MRPRSRQAAAGFSLVELIVSSALFLVMATGALALFAITNRQTIQSQTIQEQQFAIGVDLATIQRMNDRYTCASGTCTVNESGGAPGENDYFPTDASAQATFLALCQPSPSAVNPPTLSDALIALIVARPATAEMQQLGISRTVLKDNESTAAPLAHRYTVTWLSNQQAVLRQVTLTPTAAAWCP